MRQLSIVVPTHNEEPNIPVLFAAISKECAAAGIDFEVLFVDDGSTDQSVAAIRSLARFDGRVRALRLSRNFGHQAAVSIGLREARAEAVAVMDADLQDRPADLVRIFERWRESGADVVYAIRRTRKGNPLLRLAYLVFYRLLAKVANISIQMDSGDFAVMSQAFVQRLNDLPERLRFVRGLRAWLGGNQIGYMVDRDDRHAGVPSYTFGRLLRLALDGMVSFSDAPLRAASVAGLAVSVLAFGGMIVVLAWKLMGLLPSGGGAATIALAVLFLGGIQLLTIGILGEYVGRVFDEVKRRPVAIVEEVIGAPNE